jgi:predicted dehydrogenase
MSTTASDNDVQSENITLGADAVRWAFVGTGDVSKSIAADFGTESGSKRVAVASRSAAGGSDFASQFGFERSGDLEEVLSMPDVDAVYIATPHGTHRDIALKALAAGKHVLIEKPMGIDRAQVEEIFEAASARGLFAMEAMWMKFSGSFRKLMDHVAEGAIGDVRSVRASFGVAFPTDQGSRWSAELHGSTLLDQGIYPVTMAMMVLGSPDEIIARGSMRPDGVDLAEHVTFEYDGGRYAQLAASMVDYAEPTASINGTKGWISVPWPFWATDRFATHSGELMELFQPTTTETAREGNGFVPMIRAANEAIKAGGLESPLHTRAATLEVFRVLDEIRSQLEARHLQA